MTLRLSQHSSDGYISSGLEVADRRKPRVAQIQHEIPLRVDDLLLTQLNDKYSGIDFSSMSPQDLAKMRRKDQKEQRRIYVDSLTGILNRDGLIAKLQERYIAFKKYGQDTTVAFYDIDNFGRFNKENGQKAGDKTLREFVKIINSNIHRDKRIRGTSCQSRPGGEEFAMISTLSQPDLQEFLDYVQGKTPVPFTAGISSLSLVNQLMLEKAYNKLNELENKSPSIEVVGTKEKLEEAKGNFLSLILDPANAIEMQAKKEGKGRVYTHEGIIQGP